MGYTTTFKGRFEFDRPLDLALIALLREFSNSRRMKREIRDIHGTLTDKFGLDGELYVPSLHHKEYTVAKEFINQPPGNQPGLWCDFTPSLCGRFLMHNGSEKTYEYVEWINYLIDTFIAPNGYKLNGRVYWQGERDDDKGVIVIDNNVVKTYDLFDLNFLDIRNEA